MNIRTPEGIEFSILLAGPVTRFLALCIDFAVISVISETLISVMGFLSVISIDFFMAAGIIAYFIVSVFYSMIMEWLWRGQTIGKRVLRLRVMDEHGLRLQFSQIVIRNLLRFIDTLPLIYLVGGLACFVSRKSQRLGDFAANTIVIRTPHVAEPNLEQLLTGKFNSLKEHAHLAARLRHHVSPQEAQIAMRALLRRDQFDPKARVELFAEIADHFKSIVKFPEEATEGITDEQYIRNVVDILFQTSTGK